MEARVVVMLVMMLALAVGACGGGGPPDDPGPSVEAPPGVEPVSTIGAPEGELALLAPPGYVAPESTAGLACEVSVDVATSTDELVRRFSAGGYDGVLGNGDATVRLISAGSIAPVNTELVPNYADVYDGLKEQPFNSIGGQMFALPVGRRANVLVYRRSAIPGSLASLGALLDPPQVASLGEQVTVPDDPHAIAEAALWVARKRDDLEITDPYELDRRQFEAVVEILRLQEPFVSAYWTEPRQVARAFRAQGAVAALAPQSTAAALEARPGAAGPITATGLREGSLGESPAWMVAARARHPNCMYAWLDRALDPEVQAATARAADLAPANREACELIEAHCDRFRASDDGFYSRVLFKTTPAADCGDERGRVCVDWEEWVRAWESLTDP